MVNPAWDGNLEIIGHHLPAVVRAVEAYLADRMEGSLAEVSARLKTTSDRLERWQNEARAIADNVNAAPRRRQRLAEIERITGQIKALIDNHTPAQTPLIRVIGALVPTD